MSYAALLQIGEAAKYLGVHPDTLRAWAKKGAIPATRTGGKRWRFAQDDLDQFVIDQRNTPEKATA